MLKLAEISLLKTARV